ncbi:MAG: hypothetical protein KF837_17255 [Labilithrix sp.]|nr:hypothetical protein [Labilithrix sp.]
MPRDASQKLWTALIDDDKRHFMLLDPGSWPARAFASARRISSFPANLLLYDAWVVFWSRSAAAIVKGPALGDLASEILMHDDEGVIALNTNTYEVLFSVGGHGTWMLGRRD